MAKELREIHPATEEKPFILSSFTLISASLNSH